MALNPATPTEPPTRDEVTEQALDMLARTGGDLLIAPIWGTRKGACLCPKGKDCSTPGKHGPGSWKDIRTHDVARIETMLKNAGTPNYCGSPTGTLVIIDVDGEDVMVFASWAKAMGLPQTLTVGTANGYHYYYRVPDGFATPARLNIGNDRSLVVRSEAHPGYAIGPGSVHASGTVYRVVRDVDIEVIPVEAWRLSRLMGEKTTPPPLTLTVKAGVPDPSTVQEGGRHDYLRDRARTLRGGGLTGDDLFNAVSAINRKLPSPKTDDEVRRAIGDVETKFDEDPTPDVREAVQVAKAVEEAKAVGASLLQPVATYRVGVPTSVEWLADFGYFGGVTLVSGPPKSGKSTLLSQLVGVREHGGYFLGHDVPTGPTVYVSEEGGIPLLRKLPDLQTTMVLDRRMFVEAGLKSFEQLLTVLGEWCDAQTEKAMVVIDTLAIWGQWKDENDSAEGTKRVGQAALFAQQSESAVFLTHHSRKGGGAHGEAIRGSSAILATVDHSIELMFGPNEQSTDRVLSMRGRMVLPSRVALTFDSVALTYARDTSLPQPSSEVDGIPVIGSGPGATRDDLRRKWGKDPRKTAEDLVKRGLLIEKTEKVGRVLAKVYYQPKPLLDLTHSASVSDQMSAIFARGDDDD